MRLRDKTAIVTGAARGIGRATAFKFASEGARVAVVDKNIDGAKQVASDIIKSGGKATALQVNLIIKNEVWNMVENVIREFQNIHILVNNAGVTRHRPLLDLTEEDWDYVLNNDLKSAFFCTQAVLPQMMRQKYGKIINISSSSGIERTTARPTMANYAAAKAGVIQLTKVTSKTAGHYNINVNAIAPGLIETEMMYISQTKEQVKQLIETKKQVAVLDRIGQPEDIANLALFLASDESSFISAQVICCDGGTTDRL